MKPLQLIAKAYAVATISLLFITSHVQARLHVENGKFIDDQGGQIILRGYNLSQHHKFPDRRPNTDPALFTRLKSLGVNVVRHQFNWEAYEPYKGVYNEAYLDYYLSVINRAGAAGIYVFVDFHQDLWSRNAFGGCGEGMPLWTLPFYIKAETPRNDNSCSMWAVTGMLNESTLDRLFNDFYRDTYGTRTSYLNMLGRVTQRLVGNPAVIGYEPLNEPWGYAADLHTFHRLAVQKIRSIDPGAIAILEPVVNFTPLYPYALHSSPLKNVLSAPKPAFNNVAIAPHYYNISAIALGFWWGDSYATAMKQFLEAAQYWNNAAIILGEFGAKSTSNMPSYLDDIYTQLDNTGTSGTQWAWTPEWNNDTKDGWNMEDFSVVDNNGNLRINARARPNASRVAGNFGSLKVIYTGGVWPLLTTPSVQFKWTADRLKGVTTLFVPYPSLFGRTPKMSVSGAGVACVQNVAAQEVTCNATQNVSASITLY